MFLLRAILLPVSERAGNPIPPPQRKEAALMRRIATMLTVVAPMTVMMAMSVAPAFAASPTYTCCDVPAKQKHLFVKAGYACTRDP